MNTHQSDKPLDWVIRFAPLIHAGGAVLDLACGNGRHANYLAGVGHIVTAVDRNLSGFTRIGNNDFYELIEADLEDGSEWPLRSRRFKAIIVTNYLYRPLFPAIIDALDTNGILIYETFSLGNAKYGRPSNPDFLLTPGELLSVCKNKLRVIAFEEGLIENPTRAVKQRICAINRSRNGEPASI
ncbi:MAG: SAM-dependent methyltransferase [Alphaproteobacteria bacterium]|nr:SAM-dependent methyltransferase [Alphaproteobacteria bacterium]